MEQVAFVVEWQLAEAGGVSQIKDQMDDLSANGWTLHSFHTATIQEAEHSHAASVVYTALFWRPRP